MDNIPPEIMALLEELSQGGMAEDQNDLLAAQYKTAGEMRKTPNPQGRTVRDQFIAQNPLEQIAATTQQIQGNMGQRDAMNQMNANLGTTGKGVRALMLAKLLRDYQPAPAPTGVVGGLPTPPEAIPFAQTPPWEDPWYPGVDGVPAPAPAPAKPKAATPGLRRSTGATESW